MQRNLAFLQEASTHRDRGPGTLKTSADDCEARRFRANSDEPPILACQRKIVGQPVAPVLDLVDCLSCASAEPAFDGSARCSSRVSQLDEGPMDSAGIGDSDEEVRKQTPRQ